ncbi:MAG: dihydropteroate synthase [Methanomassiliicoccales archaeon]|nr:dihydropteroate synthase [Methanomassiliicoccales archaeon]
MARVRIYSGLDEALSEWRRLGVPEGALGRMDLDTKRFIFIDGVGKEECSSLLASVERVGGRGFHCKGERALLAITPLSLEQLMMEGGSASVQEMGAALRHRFDEEPPAFEWEGGSLDLSSPRVMGVLNVTPDSFSDGGRHLDAEVALQRARTMREEGADLIDVGGESTRPGALPVDAGQEWERIAEVIRRASDELDVPISVDTRRPEVAIKALRAGASLVNDVSGLQEGMRDVVRGEGAAAIIMHMRGDPRTMQSDTRYTEVVGDTYAFLERQVRKAVEAGVPWEGLAVDPGLGFGKDLQGNMAILSRMGEYRSLGRPVLLGASRKSFLGQVLGSEAGDRLEGSLAAAAVACWQGVHLFRVHDVRETVRTLRMVQAMKPR